MIQAGRITEATALQAASNPRELQTAPARHRFQQRPELTIMENEPDIIEYLALTVERGGRICICASGSQPMVRLHGDLVPVSETILDAETVPRVDLQHLHGKPARALRGNVGA